MSEVIPTSLGGENMGPKCPFHRIEEASRKVLIRVSTLFGKPNLVHVNTIGWVPGKSFVDFLRDYRANMDPRDVGSPLRFEAYEPLVNKAIFGVPIDQNHDQMSSLGCHLCVNFFLENQSRLRSEINSPQEMKIQDHFYANAMLVFQTYDAILITGAQHCQTREDWSNIKESMKKTAIRIAMMGGGPQEVFTNYVKGRFHKELPEGKYALTIMPELESTDFIGRVQNHIRNAMQVIGGYGYCPALKDGTLEAAFDILYDIYTEMLINRQFSNK